MLVMVHRGPLVDGRYTMVFEIREHGIAVRANPAVPLIARRLLELALGGVVSALTPGSDAASMSFFRSTDDPVIRGVGKREIEINVQDGRSVRFRFRSLAYARAAISSLRLSGHPVEEAHLALGR
jgi:hypothetical protein